MSEIVRALGVDPGSYKTGLAVVEGGSDLRSSFDTAFGMRILEKRVVPSDSLAEEVQRLLTRWSPAVVVVGDKTRSREIVSLLSRFGIPIVTADEHMTSLQARARYFTENPPKGFRRLLPSSMQTPPVPVDDYAAVILAERHLLTVLHSSELIL